MRKLAPLLLLLAVATAWGGKAQVTLVTPSTTTAGTPLTDLGYGTVYWGTCTGSVFGTEKGGVNYAITQTGVTVKFFVYPSGLTQYCFIAVACTTQGTCSAPSNTVMWSPIATLGSPIILNPGASNGKSQ